MVGAVVAAALGAACCIAPAVLAVVGISGVGFASAFEPYRHIFIGVALLMLAVGFYLTYRRPRPAVSPAGEAPGSAQADACGCEAPRTARLGKVSLWVATVLVVLFAAYPYVSSAFAGGPVKGSTKSVAREVVARFRVEGMTCESCTTKITDALAAKKGVVRAEVSYDDKRATVTYDPAVIKTADLVKVIEGTGYKATLEGV